MMKNDLRTVSVIRTVLLWLLIIFSLFITDFALAQQQPQINGGGNFLSGFTTWVLNNVIPTIGVIIIAAIGIGIVVSRLGGVIFAVCGIAGIWIAANAQSLYSTFIG